jgi:hypothetical protein
MIQTIEKLKSYFYEHAYPTWQQFHDLLDSFRHKNDKVPITDVDGLSDMLNGKAATSTVSELAQEVEGKEDAGVAASLVADEATARQQADENLQQNINAKADLQPATATNDGLMSKEAFKKLAIIPDVVDDTVPTVVPNPAILGAGATASFVDGYTNAYGQIAITPTDCLGIDGYIAEVTFGKPYAKPPVVVITGGNNFSGCFTAYAEVTKNGFKIYPSTMAMITQIGSAYIFNYVVSPTTFSVVHDTGVITRERLPIGTVLSSYSSSDYELSPWQSGFSVNPSTGVFTKPNHGFVANTAIEMRQNGGQLPAGFLSYTDANDQEFGMYYIIQVNDVNTFTLLNPFANAIVKPTDAGSGEYQMRAALNKISIPVPEIAACTSISILIDFILGCDGMNIPMYGFSFNNDQANTCLCRGKKNYFALADSTMFAYNARGLVEIVITRLESGSYFVRANLNGCCTYGDNYYYAELLNTPYPIVGKWLNDAALQTIEFGDFGNNTRWLKSLSASVYQQ